MRSDHNRAELQNYHTTVRDVLPFLSNEKNASNKSRFERCSVESKNFSIFIFPIYHPHLNKKILLDNS